MLGFIVEENSSRMVTSMEPNLETESTGTQLASNISSVP